MTPPVREIGPYRRQTMPAGKALIVVLITLALGSLLNVRNLIDAAERQQEGVGRSVSLVLVWPVRQLSHLLFLDRPREFLADRLGRDLDAGQAGGGEGLTAEGGEGAGDELGNLVIGPDGLPERPLETDALAAAAALAGREAVDLGIAGATALPPDIDPNAVALENAARLTERLERPFTEEDPLRIVVMGDSLTEQVGPTLIDRTNRPGVPAQAVHDFHYSSGLSRPDFYDWPARAAQLAEEQDPDIWVVMMGANDAQDVRDAQGHFQHFGTPEWEAIYRQRVGSLMDQLTGGGRAVIWLGQPIMRDASFDERMAYVNTLYAQEGAQRSLVSYIDSRVVFGDESGRYADYLPASNGQLVQMRLPDGIHLTRAGAERLVTQVLPLLPLETSSE